MLQSYIKSLYFPPKARKKYLNPVEIHLFFNDFHGIQTHFFKITFYKQSSP